VLVPAAQAAMYRWVDANGRVHYGDTLPSNYQQRGAAEMNKDGRVVGRTQSEAERRAEAARAAETAVQKKAAAERARLDRALLSTYTSEEEIDLARDRALDIYRANLSGFEMRLKAVNVNVADLKKRVAGIEKAGKPVSPNLREQYLRAQKEQLDLQRSLKGSEKAMLDITEKYALEKARYREITAKAN
jgi:hypothetical protein